MGKVYLVVTFIAFSIFSTYAMNGDQRGMQYSDQYLQNRPKTSAGQRLPQMQQQGQVRRATSPTSIPGLRGDSKMHKDAKRLENERRTGSDRADPNPYEKLGPIKKR
ncbi:MAG: hypothetical protein OEY33_02460 [Bdellovibrionales bacterium]|nr:hypothetical protein [Bdellovibrionales bacterium]